MGMRAFKLFWCMLLITGGFIYSWTGRSVAIITDGVTFKVADELPEVVRVVEGSPDKHFKEHRQESCGKVLQETNWTHGEFCPQPNGVTFKVADKLPEVVRVVEGSPDEHYLAGFKECRQESCGKVLQETKWTHGEFCPQANGFVQGIIDAYNGHHNLVIRPDDVWLAIITQFGIFVNANAEAMRSMFVEHEGKKKLTVQGFGTLESANYGRLAQEMTKELKKNVNDHNICDWILPKFSTTTDDDTIVGSVAMMATMKNYFSYEFYLMCGIPQVTLAGTVQDWEEIHHRVDKLKNYGEVCSKWAGMLRTITAQLLQTSKGNIDLNFWSQICHYRGGGSGPRYLSGWVSVFCAFDSKGKWQASKFSVDDDWGERAQTEYPVINTNDIPPGYLTVDVLVNDNGAEYKTLMFSGHMGYDIVDDRKGIAPKLAWAIVLKNGNPTEESNALQCTPW